jgi:broad specificity phosphatase PhoE
MSQPHTPQPNLDAREQRFRRDVPFELLVVRHAEPDWEAVRSKDRDQEDPALTAYGRQQAADLAEHLRGLPLAAVYCSPLARARETAAAIAAPFQLTPTVVSGLAEIGVPLLKNASQIEVDNYFLAAMKRPLWDHWQGFPGGGEPFDAFHARVTAAVGEVLAPYSVHAHDRDGFAVWSAPARAHTLRIGMVAHGGTNGVILAHLLGIAAVPWEWMRFETPLAAYSVLALRAFTEEGYIWSLQQFGRRAG